MAGRYATALFELARDANAIDPVKADLERFDALVAESADLERLVRSPVFSADEQLHALSAVLGRAGIGGLAAQFLKLADVQPSTVRGARHGARISRAGRRHKGETTAEVTVAEKLKDDHVAALRGALKAVSGKDVDSISRSIPPSSAGW